MVSQSRNSTNVIEQKN